jgi:folate-binding protein YgfZ
VSGRGKDAYDFLHRQLTNDPPARDDRFVLAAWNDAKGRVRALFRIVRGAEGPLLIAERDGLEAVLAKLRVFVLRSDVELTPSTELTVGAVIGDAGSLLESRGIALGADRGSVSRSNGILWLRQSSELIHVVGAEAELERLGAELVPVSSEHAARAEIAAGLPSVGSALAERYVAQMLNLDRLDGVAFDKGCYPGQEVVARLHHLGSVKRRLSRFASPQAELAPPPGTVVLDAAGNEVGDVVRAVTLGDQLELLAVVQLDAARKELFAGEGRIPIRPAALTNDAADG